jgi:hypothetical protein
MGEAAVKILKGADPSSIKVSEQDYYQYLFDWRELKRWNLLNSDLIPGSTIIKRHLSKRYKGLSRCFFFTDTFIANPFVLTGIKNHDTQVLKRKPI